MGGRQDEFVRPEVPVGRRRDARFAGNRVRRIHDVGVALPHPVDQKRLLVEIAGDPFVEVAVAAPDGQAAVAERRPCERRPRRQVPRIVHVALHAIADPGRHEQAAGDPPVVLHVDGRLQRRVRQVRIAHAAAERRRLARVVVGEAGEGEGAEVVADVVGGERSALDERAGPPRVGAAHVVEVGGELEGEGLLASAHLRAAAGEGVVHADGRRFDRRLVLVVGGPELEPGFREHPPPDGPVLRHADHHVGRLAGVRAAEEVESADAEVARLAGVDVHAEPHGVVLRDALIHACADVEAVARLLQGVGDGGAVGQHGEQVRRRVLIAAAAVDRERRPVGTNRPRQREPVLAQLLVGFLRRERVAGVERLVEEVEIAAAPQRPHPRHRHDVDVHDAHHAAVVLGGEHVHARQPDGADLGLRRQPPAGEPVDADDGPGRRHRLQHRLHLVRVVGQRVDLLAREDGAEGAASRVQRGTLPVAADGEALLHALDSQGDTAADVAAAHAHVPHDTGLEPRELDLDRVAPVGQIADDGDAGAASRDRLRALSARGGVLGHHAHRGVRHHQARLVNDGDDEAAGARLGLGGRRRDGRGDRAARTTQARRRIYFATWNFFASIFGFTLMVSNTSSSVGLPSIERWIRWGHCTPPTFL